MLRMSRLIHKASKKSNSISYHTICFFVLLLSISKLVVSLDLQVTIKLCGFSNVAEHGNQHKSYMISLSVDSRFLFFFSFYSWSLTSVYSYFNCVIENLLIHATSLAFITSVWKGFFGSRFRAFSRVIASKRKRKVICPKMCMPYYLKHI